MKTNSTNSNPEISVTIPAYNAERFIEEALGYIRNQTFDDFECIVIDDGSTDTTADIVRRIAKLDSRIRLVQHKKNKCLAAARNTGIKTAKGKYLITLDADDIFDKDLLKLNYEKAEATNADIVVFNYDEHKIRKDIYIRHIVDERVVPTRPVFSYKDLKVNEGRVRLEALSNIGWNKLYRRQFLDRNNLFFNEKLLRYEDLEFVLRCYMLAQKIAFIPRSLVTYRTEISSTSNQATLSKYPAAMFDALMSLHKFFRDHSLYDQYKNDLNDLAVYHILAVLLVNTPEGQRQMLNYAPRFFKDLGLTDSYISQLSEGKQNIVNALRSNDFDAYIMAERKSLIDEKDLVVSRIPPLEERIQLELRELNHYRDNPSLRTAGLLFKRALKHKLSGYFSKRNKPAN